MESLWKASISSEMPRESLNSKVALITGSSRGIGSAIARKFATKGCDVALNYRKAGGASQRQGENLRDEIQALGRNAILIQADIGVRDAVKHLVQDTKAHFGRLDFLILNAARAPFKPLERLFERELRQLVETNYLGNIFCVQEALPMLAASEGAVIFVSSLGSRFYNRDYPLGSMKAAMECVVRDLAESLRGQNVSVNGVCAGLVRTDSVKTLRQHWDWLERVPDKYFIDPEEIADVVAFLCARESRGILGQTLVVDRGLSNKLHEPFARGGSIG